MHLILDSHLAVTSFLSFQEWTLLHFSCWQQSHTHRRGFLCQSVKGKVSFSVVFLEVFDTEYTAVSSPSQLDVQSSCWHPLHIPSFWVPLVLPKKMPHLSAHAILFAHFGFSHLSLSLSLWKLLFAFCLVFLLYLFPFPPAYWPRISLNSLIWITPLSLETG